MLSTDDMDSVVEAAVGVRVDNTGQASNAGKRFIVAAGLYDEFLGKFRASMVPGSVGSPLSSAAAAQYLSRQVEQAVSDVLISKIEGEPHGPLYPPAVLTSVEPENSA